MLILEISDLQIIVLSPGFRELITWAG